MLNKIRKVEKVFKQLDRESEKFGKHSGLHCLPNCTQCCTKKGLEANVLEFLPLANHLVKNNLHEAALELLESEPEHCINLAKSQNPDIKAGCNFYEFRGLICRLFGFSAVRDKNQKLAVYTCAPMKNELHDTFRKATEQINAGMKVPIVADIYYHIYFIDSQMANDYNPINVSIRKAIEKVAYFYACKPKMYFKNTVQANIENKQ